MLSDYYRAQSVRSRMLEFLGGPTLETVTAVYVTGEDRTPTLRYRPRSPVELWSLLDRELDVGRSLWDREALLAHLDIDYINFTYPAESHMRPIRTADLLAPVAEAIETILLRYGIAPLHLLSGGGRHFVWRIGRGSRAFHRLVRFGRLSDSLRGRYRVPQPPAGQAVEPQLGRAYSGLGCVMEYLAHRVLEAAAPVCNVPVLPTAVRVGPGSHGCETISVDISEYGDPLHTRPIRIPFSVYWKPWQLHDLLGPQASVQAPRLLLIPLHEMSAREGLIVMRDAGETARLAEKASVQIPEQSEGTEKLLDDYTRSSLAAFHEKFYSENHDPPAAWAGTYDRFSSASLPPCGRQILDAPNPALLKPAKIQHVTRLLLARGWHPRHIGGLIRSKYERPHGWGHKWYESDAATRADFYVRMFSGLVMTGLDQLVDFNCHSAQEKGLCLDGICCAGLEDERAGLRKRSRK